MFPCLEDHQELLCQQFVHTVLLILDLRNSKHLKEVDLQSTKNFITSSITEQLPALEHGVQLPGGEDGAEVPASEYEAARVLLRYLKDRVKDLDRDLPPAVQAEVC
jgi:hypothetical protein